MPFRGQQWRKNYGVDFWTGLNSLAAAAITWNNSQTSTVK